MCGHYRGLPSAPDPPGGMRFCIHCNDSIPIVKFPSGLRRYVCRMHVWISSGKRSAQKMLNNPQKRALSKVWARDYKDVLFFKRLVLWRATKKNQLFYCAQRKDMQLSLLAQPRCLVRPTQRWSQLTRESFFRNGGSGLDKMATVIY